MILEENINKDNQALNEIRNRSIEEYLDSKLENAWMTKGYSKSSVKEYVNHLLKEIDYQKDSFKVQIKEILDEKERLINEKNLVSKQLEDSVQSLKELENENSKIEGLYATINNLNSELDSLRNIDNSVEIEELNNQLNEYREYIDKLEKNNSESVVNDEVYNELLDKIEVLNNENLRLNSELERLSNVEIKTSDVFVDNNDENFIKEYESLKSQIAEYERFKIDNQMLSAEILALSRLIKDFTQRDKDNNNKIVQLNKDIDDLKEEHKLDIQSVSANFEKRIEDLNGEIQKVNNELNDEKNQRTVLLNERAELQLRLSSCLEYLNELYDKVDYLQSSNKILSKQLEEQRSKNRLLSGLDIPPISLDAIKNIKNMEIDEDKLDFFEVDSNSNSKSRTIRPFLVYL